MALREIILELGVDVDQSDIDNVTSTLDKLKGAAVTVGTVFATGALAVGFNKLIDFASTAAERTNKFNAIFTDAAGDVTAQLDDISERTGIASGTLQGFAADIGAIVKPALGSSAAAGKMGASVAELALDIASFRDLEPEEALAKLQAGLVGSTEPLLNIGIDVRKTSEDIENFAKSIGKSVKALTRAELTQARYNAVVRQLGAAGGLGDATKTADDFANAQRGLNSQITTFGELLGDFFLKDAKETTVRFREIVKAVNAWLAVNREIIQQRVDQVFQVINNTIKGILIGARAVVTVFEMVGEAIGGVASAVLLTVAGIALLVAILGAPVVAILAIGAAIGLVIDDLVVFSEGGESLFGDLLTGLQTFLGEFEGVGPLFESLMASIGDLFSSFFDDTEGSTLEFFDKLTTDLSALWSTVVEEWLPVIEEFLAAAISKVEQFTGIAVEKAKELFGGLAETVGEALKDIFGGTIGRILIDFLGAKAGAAVGEFMGRLVGQLAGRIAGKGIIGKALGSRLGQELFALVGKGIGGIGGALTADELALNLQDFINAPAAIGPSAAATQGLMNAPTTSVEVNVDASGNAQPQAVGTAVVEAVSAELERVNRVAMQQLVPGPGPAR